MNAESAEIAQIVAQASSLFELLGNDSFKADQTINQTLINEQLTRWCQVAAQGDWKTFQKWLNWNGLNIDEVCSVLDKGLYVSDEALPNWSRTLENIIQVATNFPPQEDSTLNKFLVISDNPLPFEDILLPIILVARRRLCESLSSSPGNLLLELLSNDAYLALEHDLLWRLTSTCAKALEAEFSQFRPLGFSLLHLIIKDANVSPSKNYYNAFTQKLLQDGLLTFFQKYPILGRLIATIVDFWVEAIAEFLQRLEADLPKIQHLYCPLNITDKNVNSSTHLGQVIEVQPSLSDPHNRGRSVIAITFESGLKLVYKPKNLGLEVAYHHFLNWCNQHSSLPSLKVLKVLDCQSYGWVEYVEQQPCEDLKAAQRFYQRVGMLLCILYVLRGTDCHHENLIASNEHPVLIDAETLVSQEPNLPQTSPQSAEASIFAEYHLFDSVLRTGLLPRWDFNQEDRAAYDISGLGSIDLQPFSLRVPQWKFINTDDMQLVDETVTMPVGKNVPVLNEVNQSPSDYVTNLVEGFEQMYQFLIEQKESLLNPGSPIEKFQAQQIRFIARATQLYERVKQKFLTPEFLRNGMDRSIELDILSRRVLPGQEQSVAWSLGQAERQALEQLDIPYFGFRSNGEDLTIGLEQPIKQFFQNSSYEQLLTRVRSLSKTDLVQQLEIIQAVFYTGGVRAKTPEYTLSLDSPTVLPIDSLSITPLNEKQLLDCAEAIALNIQRRVIRGHDGSANWIGLAYVSHADRFQLQPLNINSLYDGGCGIALFLAALDRIMGNTQFRDLALSALQSLRTFLQLPELEFSQRFARTSGIGAASGIGSVIYSFVKIGQLLKEPTLIEDAQQAANLITPELIAADQKFDVMAGAAGAILGLLALHGETREPAILNKAIACGQHLLAHQVSVNGSPKAWKTLEPKPLTGFSHGASGIAYALLRLYEVTKDSAYKEAALEGIAYERSVFSVTTGNWPDLRSDLRSSVQQTDKPQFMTSWCHGAPGIGLARLGSLDFLETEEILQDVEVALQTTQRHDLQGVDNLCCGNFGRIEALLTASQKLSRPELQHVAQQRATWVVARATQMGGYQLFHNLPSPIFHPSFFLGNAGIGYTLLRLVYPTILPSVLLFE